jgi:hypothetical protein
LPIPGCFRLIPELEKTAARKSIREQAQLSALMAVVPQRGH